MKLPFSQGYADMCSLPPQLSAVAKGVVFGKGGCGEAPRIPGGSRPGRCRVQGGTPGVSLRAPRKPPLRPGRLRRPGREGGRAEAPGRSPVDSGAPWRSRSPGNPRVLQSDRDAPKWGAGKWGAGELRRPPPRRAAAAARPPTARPSANRRPPAAAFVTCFVQFVLCSCSLSMRPVPHQRITRSHALPYPDTPDRLGRD
jgi:hypothetical protein